MVAPDPELERKMRNTEELIKSGLSRLVSQYARSRPEDYLDLDRYYYLMRYKPWKEPDPSTREYVEEIREKVSTNNTDRILVICIDFSDKLSKLPTTTINNRFFGTSTNTHSLRNFYAENSLNQYIPDGKILPTPNPNIWYRAPRKLTYYRIDPSSGRRDGMGRYPHNTQKLFEDCLDLIANDPNVPQEDLKNMDVNKDGKLNNVMIIYAGPHDIWAHQWSISPKTVKGIQFSKYAINAEYGTNPSDEQKSGTDIHEMGHLLGMPDLYDYDYSSYGAGYWSVMAYGSWGGSGAIPTHFDVWCKNQLGWITPKENVAGTTILKNIENNIQDSSLKYTTSDTRQYFLIENRQKIGFDKYIPGNGLLIWRINRNKTNNSSESCYMVGLLQADGSKQIEKKINMGDAGDPYPGSKNNRSWGKRTNPSTTLCNGTLIDILIDQISDSSTSMSLRVTKGV